MSCKVNWPRFYTRQRLMAKNLALRCGCKACKKLMTAMADTDKVLAVNEKNRSRRLYEPNESEKL